MITSEFPCKNCVPPTRYLGCHDKCEKYLSIKKSHNNRIKQIRQAMHSDRQYDNMMRDRHPKKAK